jgi:3-phosphoglycerate kinase
MVDGARERAETGANPVMEASLGWKTLDDVALAGKTVLVRVDINVPMEAGRVTDATRIEKIVPTVEDIIAEVAAARQTERGTRADDRRSETAMEDRKRQGYF